MWLTAENLVKGTLQKMLCTGHLHGHLTPLRLLLGCWKELLVGWSDVTQRWNEGKHDNEI